MLIRCICSAAFVAFALVFASPDGARAAADDGIVKFKSAYDMPETIKRMLFLTSDPDAGLDWPVRVLVYQDAKGDVWVAYTDFAWIARRHGITNREKEFKMASEMIASITSTVQK